MQRSVVFDVVTQPFYVFKALLVIKMPVSDILYHLPDVSTFGRGVALHCKDFTDVQRETQRPG